MRLSHSSLDGGVGVGGGGDDVDSPQEDEEESSCVTPEDGAAKLGAEEVAARKEGGEARHRARDENAHGEAQICEWQTGW